MPEPAAPSYEELAARVAALEAEVAGKDAEASRLSAELEERTREVTETLAQQEATGTVLALISQAPGEVERVLVEVAQEAMRLCGGEEAYLAVVRGDAIRRMDITAAGVTWYDGNELGLTKERPADIAYLERRTVHEYGNADEMRARFPEMLNVPPKGATVLATPFRTSDGVVGFLNVRRLEVRPFNAREIAVLEAFADQAVIAIENARLFKELEQRNLDVTEALQRQTAMAEVLEVISSSPTSVVPVLEAIVERAAELCSAEHCAFYAIEDDSTVILAQHAQPGKLTRFPPVGSKSPLAGRVVAETVRLRKTVREGMPIDELDRRFPMARQNIDLTEEQFLAALSVPIVRDGVVTAILQMQTFKPAGFSDVDAALVETFADQAVIAIENARLFNELQERNREVSEALDQQTAVAGVLQAISRSAFDLNTVLDQLTEEANRLVGADISGIQKLEGDTFSNVSAFPRDTPEAEALLRIANPPGVFSFPRFAMEAGEPFYLTLDPNSPAVERAGDSPAREFLTLLGTATTAYLPLLGTHGPIGCLTVTRRGEIEFTDAEKALLQTFADQAVIAIENARLFNELQERNREVSEALDQQTAMADVLEIIAASPTDPAAVLDEIVTTIGRLCGSDVTMIAMVRPDGSGADATVHRPGLGAGITREAIPPDDKRPGWEAVRERRLVHAYGTREEVGARFPNAYDLENSGAGLCLLAAPLLRDGTPIGFLAVRRNHHPEPFNDQHVAVMESFADQAVIAIENARLFNELQERNREVSEALDQQTAVAGVLQAISRSAFDVDAVLDQLTEQANRLVRADISGIQRLDGDTLVNVSAFPKDTALSEAQLRITHPPGVFSVPRMVMEAGQPFYLTTSPDDPMLEVLHTPEEQREFLAMMGTCTIATLPLLGSQGPVGTLTVTRRGEIEFTNAEKALLQTFADQAVIAIENARLFNELEERNREVSEALEQQTAIAEVLETISRSPTNLQPVLDEVSRQAAVLLNAEQASIHTVSGGLSELVSRYAAPGFVSPDVPAAPTPLAGRTIGEAVATRRTVHFAGTQEELASRFPGSVPFSAPLGTERFSQLTVPLLREEQVVGALIVARTDGVPFADAHVRLLETFADQAVIAIENARLFNELQERNQEVSEALSREEATAEILRQISTSPEDLEQTLTAISTAAWQLADGTLAAFWLDEGERLVLAGHSTRSDVPPLPPGSWQARTLSTHSGRTVIEGATLVVDDLTQTSEDDFPGAAASARRYGWRSGISVPVRRGDAVLASLAVCRDEVRPFEADEIALLEGFASQAAIALSNAWLLRDLRKSNAEVTEALDQQTAMAEVLGIIAASPTDVSPVLEAIVARAASICDAREAALSFVEDGRSWPVARWWAPGGEPSIPMEPTSMDPTSNEGRMIGEVVETKAPIHFSGRMDEFLERYPQSAPFVTGVAEGMVTLSTLPLLRGGAVVGALFVFGAGAAPFTARQQAALEAFADQAVIAIENARLFNELQERNREVSEALDQQTALGEVLGIIAASATDAQPVLEAVVRSAALLCDADDGVILRPDGEILRQAATYGDLWTEPQLVIPNDATTVSGQVMHERRVIAIDDLKAPENAQYTGIAELQKRKTWRAVLVAPLLRGDEVLGTISLNRKEARPFSAQHIALLQTFADQAVIAIENARLFNELQERNREVSEALDRQTAMAEVLGIISRSPIDASPVLNSIAAAARRVLAGFDAAVHVMREGELNLAASVFERDVDEDEQSSSFQFGRPVDRGFTPSRGDREQGDAFRVRNA